MHLKDSVTFDAAVNAIYDHVGDYRTLSELLPRLAEFFVADTIRLGLDVTEGYSHDQFLDFNLGTEFTEQYAAYYHQQDLWFGNWLQRGERGVLTGEQLVADDQLQGSEFYNDFLKRCELTHLMVGSLDGEPSPLAGIAFLRANGRPRFSSDDCQLLGLLIPHLRRAISLTHQLETARMRANAAGNALSHLGYGLLLIDGDGRILDASPEVARLLGQRFCRRPSPYLRADDSETQALLKAAIRQATAATGSASSIIALKGRTADDCLLALVLPGHHELAAEHGSLPGHALVIIYRPGPRSSPLSPEAQRFFTLTPAEFRLCSLLVEGIALPECARLLEVSVNTVRSQLKSVFMKTGVARQQELITLLDAFRQ